VALHIAVVIHQLAVWYRHVVQVQYLLKQAKLPVDSMLQLLGVSSRCGNIRVATADLLTSVAHAATPDHVVIVNCCFDQTEVHRMVAMTANMHLNCAAARTLAHMAAADLLTAAAACTAATLATGATTLFTTQLPIDTLSCKILLLACSVPGSGTWQRARVCSNGRRGRCSCMRRLQQHSRGPASHSLCPHTWLPTISCYN
jgi:hypothetical protein